MTNRLGVKYRTNSSKALQALMRYRFGGLKLSGNRPTINLEGMQRLVDEHPNECPICHAKIQAIPLKGNFFENNTFEVAYRCGASKCQKMFIGYFGEPYQGIYILRDCKPSDRAKKAFNVTVEKISPAFCEIYNEAYAAEQMRLGQICGVGYRKALEFLIKDYLSYLDASAAESIRKTFVGVCIEKHIKNDNIKAVAKRATWLGNDETHYVRKWEDKDLSDLKKLIDLTLYWIEQEELTKEVLLDMPEGKP